MSTCIITFYALSFDDICCLSSCDSLSDLTLDGNPLANLPDHRHSMIFHISHLRSLDQMLVSVNTLMRTTLRLVAVTFMMKVISPKYPDALMLLWLLNAIDLYQFKVHVHVHLPCVIW